MIQRDATAQALAGHCRLDSGLGSDGRLQPHRPLRPGAGSLPPPGAESPLGALLRQGLVPPAGWTGPGRLAQWPGPPRLADRSWTWPQPAPHAVLGLSASDCRANHRALGSLRPDCRPEHGVAAPRCCLRAPTPPRASGPPGSRPPRLGSSAVIIWLFGHFHPQMFPRGTRWRRAQSVLLSGLDFN